MDMTKVTIKDKTYHLSEKPTRAIIAVLEACDIKMDEISIDDIVYINIPMLTKIRNNAQVIARVEGNQCIKQAYLNLAVSADYVAEIMSRPQSNKE